MLVLGAGPGGYSAAFRAADLGKKVAMVDCWPALGGVWLNAGCIPSKALLRAAQAIAETKEMSEYGVVVSAPGIDADKLRAPEGRCRQQAVPPGVVGQETPAPYL